MITIKDPATDLVAKLNGQSVGGVTLATGQNLFAGQFHPLPQLAVFMLASGGPGATPYVHGSAPEALVEQDVQCIVRGAPGAGGYSQAWGMARDVWGMLQQAVPSGYVSILGQGAPVYTPDPDNGGHLISLNFRARYVAVYTAVTPPVGGGGGGGGGPTV